MFVSSEAESLLSFGSDDFNGSGGFDSFIGCGVDGVVACLSIVVRNRAPNSFGSIVSKIPVDISDSTSVGTCKLDGGRSRDTTRIVVDPQTK